MNIALRNTQNLLRSVLLILVANLFSTSLLYAQVGPAGVGNSDGSSGEPENLIWLDASDLTSFSDGDTWPDKSGNSYNAIYTGTPGTAPTWNSSLIGGQPALQFDGNNDYLRILDDNAGDNRLDSKSTLSILAVFNSGTVVPRAIISKRAGSGGSERSWTLFINGGGFNLNGYAGSASTSGGNVSEASVSSVIGSYVADGNLKLFVNNNNVATSGSASINDLDDNVTIGLFDEGDNRFFDGDIAEILVFSDPLNNPQRTIVENYLSQKYSITISNDYFGNDTDYDGAYDQDIRGIGSDGTDKRTNSLSSGGLTIRENSSSLDADEYVMLAHNGTAHSITTNNRADVTNITNSWARDWYVEKNSGGGLAGVDGGDVSVQMIFDFAEAGLSYSGNLSEYVLLYRPASGDDFDRVYADSYTLEGGDKIVVSVPSSRLNTGYYTLGTGAPLLAKTWYVFQNGNWNDPNTWTTDASTAPLFKNPANQIPSTSDEVIIRSGRTVTVQSTTNNLVVNSIKVDGNLDLTTSTGHNFNTINGKGEIRIAGNGGSLVDNFPDGEVTGNIGFADVDNGGTVVIKAAADITLDQVRTFKNMRISLVNNTSKAILGANISLNGDLEVRNGNLQFGDGTANARTFIVNGDVLVTDNGTDRIGSISTSTANVRHTFEIKGDFTNNGDVYFTNRADFATENDRRDPGHTYYSNEASDGIVDVFFTNDNADQTVNCNNTTFFYRVVIDKGTDKTYKVSFQSTDIDNFRLLGYANDNVDADLQSEAQNTNAFALINGTAEIGGNIEIPVLNKATNYAISSTARLWVNGGDVRKTSATAIVPYGTVQVSAGYLEATGNSGLTLRENGLIKVEGGNVLTNQIRTSVQGSGSLGGYNQSGGNVEVDGGLGGASGDYYIFSLTYTGNVFIMSGGTLAVKGANSRGLMFINSDPGNVSVTGGTVTAESSTGNTAKITSRAPFYTVYMRAGGSSVGNITLDGGTSGNGGGAVTLSAQPLVVVNDLIVQGYNDNYYNNPLGNYATVFSAVTSATNINDVYVGGSFYVGRNSSYEAVFGGTAPYDGLGDLPTDYNTTYFNQTDATSVIDTIYWGVTGSGIGQLEMGSFVLDRLTGNELRTIARNGNNGGIRFDVNGNVSVLSGTLDQNAYTFRVWGSITNYDRLGTYYSSGNYPEVGGTPSTAQIRFREDPPVVINTSNEAVFGNLRFNVGQATTVELNSDVYIERMEYMNGRIYVKNHTLTVDDMWNINNGGGAYFNNDEANSSIIRVNNEGITANILVFTDGKASDGGLRLKVGANTVAEDLTSRVNNNGPITFPVGFTLDGGTTFISRPAQMKVKDFADSGYVQINVVSGELQTTDLSGGEVLQHYWRVRHTDFSTLPTVAFRFYYRGSNTVEIGRDRPELYADSDEDLYVPGYVLSESPFTRSFESDPTEDLTDIFTSTAPTTNQNASENNRTRLITFNGPSTNAEFDQSDFAGFTLANANFTAGVAGRFVGAPDVYYTTSTGIGNWNNQSKWSLTDNGVDDGNTGYPQVGDVAVIKSYGNSNQNAWVYGNNDISVAELRFDNTLGGWSPRLWMTDRTANLDLGPVSGAGTIYLEVTQTQIPSFVGSTDLGEFSSNAESVFNFKVDADNQTVDMPLNIPEYPNLRIEAGDGGNDDDNRILQTSMPVTVNGYVRMDRSSRFRINHDVTVMGDVRITWQANRTTLELGDDREVTLDIKGNLQLEDGDGNDNSRFLVKNDNQNSYEHTVKVEGDIIIENVSSGSSALDLYNGVAPNNNAILELTGNGNNVFTNASSITPDFYKVIMNKENGVSTSFSFENSFNVPLPSDIGSQPLEILNGLLILDNSSIDITLTEESTGNFFLPNTNNADASSGSGGLEIRQGVAHIDGDNTGIILDGLLRISGGELDMDDAANNGNNFIEYSSSGQASIEVTDGSLIVGSQIRRGLNSNTGILQYTQSGGIVEIGKNTAPESNRGIFEVVNEGSNFEHTGGSFTLVRDNNSPTVASLLLEPDAVNIADGTIITIGNGDTPSTQDRFGIQSNVELSEVEIASANITAKLYSLSLSTHILDIGTGVNFDANGFDLTILENLNNNGVFFTSGNSINDQLTTFQVGTTATITGTGTTNFWNFEKTGSGTLSLSKNVTVNNNATIEDGTLNTQSSAFYIKKDLLHDAIHTSASTGPGIVFNGTQQQILDRSSSGTSEFGVVNLDNASGLLIRDTEENFRINEKLTLSTGVFDVGGNLIVFPADAYIENGIGGRGVDDFNVNNMIQTNSAIRDFGIRKYFNAVSAGNETFTYPVGLVAYTPIVVTINDISAGYITARPVRDIPPITEDDEFATCGDPNITDADNVLQYYWIIKSSGITGFNGEFSMRYDQNDVEVTSPYSLINYGPARLYNTSDAWDKVFSNNDFDEATQQIYYTFNDQADATIEGIYTAGVTLEDSGDGTDLLCGAAIPDQVPQFITNDSGGGNFFATTTYDGGIAPISGETPDITVKSGDVLNFNQNNIRTRKITIESGGTLVIQDGTNNHNLGFVTGEGTIRLESDGSSVVFPTGDYEEFFPDENCSGGGGLEYAGGGDYPVLTDLPNIRRVIFSGSGERVLPNNLSLNVCEDFDIRGDVEVIVFDGNSTIHVKGNVYKSDDSQFDNGGGSSRIVMEGSSSQSIRGNFTGTDAFNELEIDNPAGITIVNGADVIRDIPANQDVVVNKTLVLTSGVLTTNANNTLTIASGGTYTGGSASSYINGPFTQNNIITNATYRFPIGKSGRYLPATISNVGAGNQNWTAEYFTSNTNDVSQVKVDDEGYGELGSVSSADMWNITSSGSNSARVRLAYGSHTGVSDVNETKVVIWDGTQWVNEGGVVVGTITSGTVTAEAVSGFSSKDFSIGSTNVSPLPVELLSFSVKMEGKAALLQWATASEKNNDFFDIQRSVNGLDWKSLSTVKGAGDSNQELSYSYTDKNPLYGVSYYRLRQVDFEGQFDYSNVVVLENFEDNAVTPDPEMILYPNPASLDELIIRASNLQPWMEVELMLLDAYGKQYIYKLIMPEELEKGLTLKQNLNLASGLYLVSIKQGSIRMQKKLILK